MMNAKTENENTSYFLDIIDWELNDLFNPEFHKYIDSLIEEVQENLKETFQLSPQLSRKENEKLNSENIKYLWNLTNNRVKYYFLFNFKIFSQFITLVSESEYQIIKRLIVTFQTINLLNVIVSNQIYQQFLASFSPKKYV